MISWHVTHEEQVLDKPTVLIPSLTYGLDEWSLIDELSKVNK